jgi:type IV secretion system protein VirB10
MSEASPLPTAGPTKLDPETLVLRGNPGRVVKFRRSAVVTIAALGSVAFVVVAWIGLRPPTFRMISGADNKLEVARPPDELANAPKSYGDVPQLGPPLPGDLGRPILAHQAVIAGAGDDRSAAQAAEAERQRAAAELKAARESGILMQVTSGRASAAAPVAADTDMAQAAAGGDQEAKENEQASLDRERDPNAQLRKLDFLKQPATDSDINPHRVTLPPSPYTLSAGSIISASLITGLNSDLPGLVTAQVTENAFDSATGRTLLIPQGARLIGRYDSVIAYGQSRALVVWERLLLPDGSSIRIDNAPATDTSGYAGLTDKIDRHSWQVLKGVALSTLLGVGTELSFGNDDGDLVSAIRRSAQLSGARAGDQLVGRSLDIQPTIKVRPGWPLRVIVHKDLVLRPWTERGRS